METCLTSPFAHQMCSHSLRGVASTTQVIITIMTIFYMTIIIIIVMMMIMMIISLPHLLIERVANTTRALH